MRKANRGADQANGVLELESGDGGVVVCRPGGRERDGLALVHREMFIMNAGGRAMGGGIVLYLAHWRRREARAWGAVRSSGRCAAIGITFFRGARSARNVLAAG